MKNPGLQKSNPMGFYSDDPSDPVENSQVLTEGTSRSSRGARNRYWHIEFISTGVGSCIAVFHRLIWDMF